MKRREFGGKVMTGAVAAGIAGLAGSSTGTASAQTARAPRKNTLMHVGGDYHSVAGPGITSKQNLEYNLRHGVRHITAQMRKSAPDGGWNTDELKKMKDDCERYAVTFEAIRMDSDYIALPKGPERDREMDIIVGNIRKAYRWE